MCLVYWIPQKIAPRESSTRTQFCCFILRIDMNRSIFVFTLFASMYRLDPMCQICVVYINDGDWIIVWFGIIILQFPERGTPWKFWLDYRFSQNSKRKWTLKGLPLDKGHFNFTFVKGRRFTNNPRMYIIFDFVNIAFCIVILVLSCLSPCFMSHNLSLLMYDASKKGGREKFG